MIYIGYADGTPVFGASCQMTLKQAEHKASRNLGADWRSRGYRVFPGPAPAPIPPEPQANPRTRARLFGRPWASLTDWRE